MRRGRDALAPAHHRLLGARDPKFGACGSILNIPEEPKFNHQIKIISGVLENESAELMQAFFRKLRDNKERPN